MPTRISRAAYADMFGPTVGDKVRLADTDLIVEVEKDFTIYGEEVKFGGGKVIRDGMGQSQATPRRGRRRHRHHQRADHRLHGASSRPTSASRDGRIAGIGKAGNPDVQPGVDIIVGPGTEVIAGEGKILTAGGIDSHIHFICPQQIEEALISGVTMMIGGGTGPATGTSATTCTPGPWHLAPHDRGGRRLPDEPRLRRQGQCVAARQPGRDGRGRRLVPQAARGLGHHARQPSTARCRWPTTTTCR